MKNKLNRPNVRKGACHPKRSAKIIPIGIPTTEATENADMIAPVALPRLKKGMISPTIARTIAPTIPPKPPAMALAINS